MSPEACATDDGPGLGDRGRRAHPSDPQWPRCCMEAKVTSMVFVGTGGALLR